ncbi:NUMOD3 domain-containing DNA-binding protein [Mycobacterium sp. NPDC050441]|uniref:NUMOD3 domain-containing DNA-binding protein n=1 Tax=Mycobacterium sp. NPDC050441 TaxID=3155403 RepID=UPI0033DE3C1F
MSEGAKSRISEMRKGAGNPNFGHSASEETRAKMSAARKGRPMPSSRRSAHTRHHTNKGVFKNTCQHCLDDQAAREQLRSSDRGRND